MVKLYRILSLSDKDAARQWEGPLPPIGVDYCLCTTPLTYHKLTKYL
jgi:hypothetical protein